MKKQLSLMFLAVVSLVMLASCNFDFMSKPSEPDLFHIHDYKERVIPPTCTEDGYTIFECACGDSYAGKKVSATGHTPVVDEGYPKTCTKDGLSNGSHCSVCGEVIVPQEVIPASHEWEYAVSSEPTCTTPGLASGMYCKECHATTSGEKVLPALGHDYHDEVHKTEYGHSYTIHQCSRCEDHYVDSLTIDYTKNYDYMSYQNNSLYSAHKSDYIAIYQALYEGCMNVFNSTQDYSKGSNQYVAAASASFNNDNISNEEAYCIANSFMSNNPQFYFLDSYMYIGKVGFEPWKITLAIHSNYYSASVRKTCQDNLKKMEKEVYQLYENSIIKTDKAKAELIHDYIIDMIDYQNGSDGKPSKEIWAHSMMGLVDYDESTGGVCECYAKTYLYLSHLLGLNSIIVVGIGNGGGHAWNYTKIGDKWYGVDVTWDDQTSGKIYKYFLCSKSVMEENHQVGSSDPNTDLSEAYFQTETPELSTTGYTI